MPNGTLQLTEARDLRCAGHTSGGVSLRAQLRVASRLATQVPPRDLEIAERASAAELIVRRIERLRHMNPFEPRNPPLGVVVFNFGRPPLEQLADYASGYHDAAHMLFQQLHAVGFPDNSSYPLFYLYRHSLELYLKALVCKGASLMRLQGNPIVETPGLYNRHALSPLLPAISAVFEAVGWSGSFGIPGCQNMADLRDLIAHIERVDPDSFAFRYPVTTRQASTHPRHLQLSIVTFAGIMDPLLEFLDGAHSGLGDHFEATAEQVLVVERLMAEWSECDVDLEPTDQ